MATTPEDRDGRPVPPTWPQLTLDDGTRPRDHAARPGDRATPAAGAGTADAAHTGTAPDVPAEPLVPTEERLLVRLLGRATLLLDAPPRARLTGWLWPLAVTLLAGVLRFANLGRPHALVFDETYYVKQAWTLLAVGYDARWPEDPNPAFEAGRLDGYLTAGDYVVHPPVGKWLIALGMQVAGPASSVGWRLTAAVVGTLSVLLIARIGRRLFASTALGTLAGLLLAVDGEAIVHSRTGLLDQYVMFFALAAFGALLLDRDQARRRLARRTAELLDSGRALGWGPRLGWRWWRLAAAVLLGLCIGSKWSGLYFLAVFGLLSVAWDATARRTVGVRQWVAAGVVRDGIPAGVVMVVAAAVTYLAAWIPWLQHPQSYGRGWAADHPGEGVLWLPEGLRSLWKYHLDMWHFHNGLESEHAYAAHPLGWIVQWRPTSFYYPQSISQLTGPAAQDTCGADACSQAITSMGNPVLWWFGAVSIVVAVVFLIRRRDWVAGAVLSGIVAGWLPWFVYAHRTIFTFYSIAFTPWVVLTLVYVIGLVVGDRDGDPVRRRQAIWWVSGLVGLIVLVSAFFYPIWTAQVVPHWFWQLHMWFPSWI